MNENFRNERDNIKIVKKVKVTSSDTNTCVVLIYYMNSEYVLECSDKSRSQYETVTPMMIMWSLYPSLMYM